MTTRNAILLILLGELSLAALAYMNHGWTLEALQAVTRYSGRFSLVIFSLIFLSHENEKRTITILSSSYFAIFALAHGIHLIELLSYVYLSQIPLVPYRLAGGFLAYLFIFLMPYLYSRRLQGHLSETRFGAITLFYLYYVWLIFFMTYLARVQGTFPNAGGTYGEHVSLLAWVSLMLGISISKLWNRTDRKKRKV